MASTNKTSNYELSQFVGSDKPAWLSDYNNDMSKIDTGIYNAQTTATGADGKADANTTAIGTLTNLNTNNKTSCVNAINEVNTLAGTADSTAGTALSAAYAAGSKADSALTSVAKFNLTNINNLTPTTNIGTISESDITFATDSTSSVFKIYGSIKINFNTNDSGNVSIALGTTSLRPDESYNINCASTVFRFLRDSTFTSASVFPRSINIGTNGVITLQAFQSLGSSVSSALIEFPPCIYFNKNFGDVPTPE